MPFRVTILTILGSNEKLSNAINNAPNHVEILFEDLENFIENTEMQINFLTSSTLEITLDQINGLLESNKSMFNTYKTYIL